jgi:uncharacterized membrane protein
MAFCAKCGSSVADGVAFCPKCGAPVGTVVTATPVGTPAGAPMAAPVTSGLTENVAGLLCYLLGWLTGIIFLVIDKRPFVRFHAAQSIVVFGALTVLRIILSFFFLGGYSFGLFWLWTMFSVLVSLATLVAWARCSKCRSRRGSRRASREARKSKACLVTPALHGRGAGSQFRHSFGADRSIRILVRVRFGLPPSHTGKLREKPWQAFARNAAQPSLGTMPSAQNVERRLRRPLPQGPRLRLMYHRLRTRLLQQSMRSRWRLQAPRRAAAAR